jgi:hypothetical protein
MKTLVMLAHTALGGAALVLAATPALAQNSGDKTDRAGDIQFKLLGDVAPPIRASKRVASSSAGRCVKPAKIT